MFTRQQWIPLALGLAMVGCSQTSSSDNGAGATPSATTVASEIPPVYPVDYFFRNSVVRSYQLSPTGEYIAMLKPWQDRMNVFVHPVGDAHAEKRITAITGRDIAEYFWVGDNTIIYSRDTGGDENYYLVSVDVTTGEERVITPQKGVLAYVVDVLPSQPDDILFSTNERDPQIFDIYRYNLKTGQTTVVAENPGNVRHWMTDHNGDIRALATSDGVNTALLYRDSVDQPFRTLKNLNFKQAFYPVAFTPDNKNLYALSAITRDKMALVEYDVSTNQEVREIFAHPDVDVSSAHYSHALNKLVSVTYVTDKTHHVIMDEGYQAAYDALRARLPNSEIEITSTDRAEHLFTVLAYSDVARPSYYLYDRQSDVLTKLADQAPWHNPEHMAPMTPISYTSRDGLTINGYLTLPKGRSAKDLPLLVLPHGGPWARDYWGFNSEVQLFANRGIAVLQMNFRGSTGYGTAFWQSSFKQWGQTMQNDITDGVNWAIDQGYAKAGDVCIYGASYGGYATLAGLTFTPDLYKCGIDYVGVSNLFTFMDAIPPYWAPFLAMMKEKVGDKDNPADAKMMRAASPVFHVDNIQAPLLVLQGAKDPRVVKSESDQIVEALRGRGVEVEYIVKENEGHGFAQLENRLEAYQAMDRFLQTHLLETPVAQPATSPASEKE